ncbi:uncharacterized protein F5Z01DRAFT_665607 [Emericellopsis atlantica]|uniref:Uncharacterized protein n=1 Tax=Emericellopsis atlantica TaxID=2614577 RepID=A0A9P7ZEL0_9HYPO|nr:uncharacterized protein F5Z01DRAFT_665607 [Emericellopsis atlantica]KAG9250659.1 hypothetical protein F5Z01DRAFT_665607 [Emericellopsis atlantica]
MLTYLAFLSLLDEFTVCPAYPEQNHRSSKWTQPPRSSAFTLWYIGQVRIFIIRFKHKMSSSNILSGYFSEGSDDEEWLRSASESSSDGGDYVLYYSDLDEESAVPRTASGRCRSSSTSEIGAGRSSMGNAAHEESNRTTREHGQRSQLDPRGAVARSLVLQGALGLSKVDDTTDDALSNREKLSSASGNLRRELVTFQRLLRDLGDSVETLREIMLEEFHTQLKREAPSTEPEPGRAQ